MNEETVPRHVASPLIDRLRVMSPKLYWDDVGLALHLAGLAERAEILYWRTVSGEEVDLVVEVDGKVLPIEIKATSRPRLRDAAHLRSFRGEYGKNARAGLLLHTGTTLEWLTPDVLAAPWWRVC